MHILEKLEQRVQELNPWTLDGLYMQKVADERSLLEQAIHYIRQLETKRVLDRVI